MKHSKIFYTLVIITCTILSTILVGLLSVTTTISIAKDNAIEILNLKCQNTCQQFDSTIKSIEQSVATLTSSAQFYLNDFQRFKTDDAYVDAYTETIRNHSLYVANNTQGAMSIYIRYNPEFTSSVSGLFYVLDKEKNEFVEVPVTDLNNCTYEESTWYHVPVANGGPTWMEPYDNTNIGYRMISYVIPYYIDGELVGVVGMDIDFDYITELIHNISVYDTGYAFLFNPKGETIVHKDFNLYDNLSSIEHFPNLLDSIENEPDVTQHIFSSDEETFSCTLTQNNMYLALAAPNDEIYEDSVTLTREIIVIAIITFIIIIILAVFIIWKIYRMAEIDELTGIFNRKYFMDYYHNLDAKKLHEYSLFMFDIDKFKHVNDTYGHNNGDLAIRHVAQLAKNTLGRDGIVARWGGDEFIGLIKNNAVLTSLDNLRKTVEQENSPDYGKITISIGVSNTGLHTNFREALDAADTALYTSKANGRNQLTQC